jgi:hypothetical protein
MDAKGRTWPLVSVTNPEIRWPNAGNTNSNKKHGNKQRFIEGYISEYSV